MCPRTVELSTYFDWCRPCFPACVAACPSSCVWHSLRIDRLEFDALCPSCCSCNGPDAVVLAVGLFSCEYTIPQQSVLTLRSLFLCPSEARWGGGGRPGRDELSVEHSLWERGARRWVTCTCAKLFINIIIVTGLCWIQVKVKSSYMTIKHSSLLFILFISTWESRKQLKVVIFRV